MTQHATLERQFEQFLADVKGHAVVVLRDDGLYRHLRCSPGSYASSFDVVTWPGCLCYVGDMGSFVFSRLPDMFEFFRGRRTALVDRGYLAEKTVAADKHDGILAFSEAFFRAAVQSDVEAWTDEWTDDRKAQLQREIDFDVLPSVSEGMGAAIQAAVAFQFEGKHVFAEFYEHRLEDYTPRFRWCCYAIPWAVDQYDQIKTQQAHPHGSPAPAVGA